MSSAILNQDINVTSLEGYKLKTKMPAFNKKNQLTGLITSEDFTFINPKNKKETQLIPGGSKVYFSNDRKIINIETRVSPERRQQLKKMQKRVTPDKKA